MIENDNSMQEKQTPTLMLAYERLTTKARKLEELEELSDRVCRKFDRTDNQPKGLDASGIIKEGKGLTEPNLIELFDLLAERMEHSINNIGRNTERVLNMID